MNTSSSASSFFWINLGAFIKKPCHRSIKSRVYSNWNPKLNVTFLEVYYTKTKTVFNDEIYTPEKTKRMIFTAIWKIRNCPITIIKTKFITVWKTRKLWILSSVATLKVHKSGCGAKETVIKEKNNVEVVCSAFWPRARPHPPHVLSFLRSRYLKKKTFFEQSPMFASKFLQNGEIYRQMVFTAVDYFQRKT